ncbi:LysM peptidoglycan-binding domain-containing protein [Streptomyces capillispiralis]|uniref:LysM domain-containing protein n=1 Tax=Streptomyces capillispiralis TaxID=68182 RepID=A0A561TIV2_9ACTN|nr:transglycosylase family protein [Streptomyces capillispiralis]TWF87022.1 LysM domain-containing protein [Streptomyces capillispiralis]GHH90562.1 peptidoglycan-binding protein LysM [Streptomyces capillispiralis]
MLSGNGRHRRPRQAPALLVAAGVTGSAIAIPLLGAGSASAADGATWDRVAECESGGSWSQNTGNGYYGGLQLTQDDWEAYGGLDYASSADQASRGQQIAVAERVLADQGVGAWRTCGLLAGLDQDSASVDIDTGVAEDSTPDPSGSPDSGDASASSSPSPTSEPSSTADATEGSKSPEGAESPESTADASADASVGTDTGTSPSASATPKTDESDKLGQTDGSSGLTGTEGTGSGRHRGGSAEEGVTEDRTSESSGRHASRGDDASRDAADGSYTVRTGDSLSSIADSLELDGGWRALYAENEQVVGTDPDLILPGQELAVGVEPGEK